MIDDAQSFTACCGENRVIVEYGILSLLPPIIAIVLAVALKQVVIPLLVAILSGAAILSRFDQGPGQATADILYGFVSTICNSVFEPDHLRAFAFSLLFGAMIGVLEAGGGMVALVNLLSKRVRSRRGAQMLITALGLGIFFDDYANTLLVGGTMRTTADRFGISRAKLAYLVDTTSAPVAGLSPISTWVVTEVSYVAAGLTAASILDVSAFALLIASLPFRFYPILSLVMVCAVSASDRDFGPMLREQPTEILSSMSVVGETPETAGSSIADSRYLSWAAVVPIVGCVFAVIASLIVTGWNGQGPETNGLIQRLGGIVSEGDSYGALILGGGVGLLLAIILHGVLGRSSWNDLVKGTYRGALQMIPAMVILWLAWALSFQTDVGQLNTGGFIASWLGSSVSPVYLPTTVFIIASGVAFSTGTSWGTMAILTPISMHLGITVSGGNPYDPIAIATLGSVLAGAIFGDHCSPISDTTVLSSRASGCDHIVHVRTQLPYALAVGLISILTGTIPVAFGLSPYICLAVGTLATISTLMVFGRKPVEEKGITDL